MVDNKFCHKVERLLKIVKNMRASGRQEAH